MNECQQSVCRWAKAHLENRDFVIIDTETTGLDNAAEVVSVAVVNAWGRVAFSSLVRPVNPIDETGKAFAVNGISNAMVERSPSARAILYPLEGMVYGKYVIAYNANFDSRLLRQSFDELLCPPHLWECAMKQYAAYYGERSPYGDYRWQNLQSACYQMGLTVQASHDAATDALATYALLSALARSL